MQKAERIEERTEPCPTPTSMLKERRKNCFTNIEFSYQLNNQKRKRNSWIKTSFVQDKRKKANG